MATKKKSAAKPKQRGNSVVVAIVAETLLIDEDQVTPGSRFNEDLECDSIDFLDIIMLLEEKFGIEITDCDAEKCQRIADLEKLVMARAGALA